MPGSASSNSAAAAKDRETEIRQILEILRKWGIHTLGQFAALDKEQIAARLGPEAVRLWERANGISNRLLKLVQPPESFDESFEFENQIETAQPLLFMLRRFFEQLTMRLSAIYLVAREITLRITFANPPQVRTQDGFVRRRNGSAAADKQSYERVFKIPQPTNDVDLLFRMLQTHLENFKSEHPIVAVALTAQPTKSISQPRMLSEFEMALQNPQQLYETLARLTALLGADRVGTPVLEETHRPDAFRMEPFAWNLSFAANSPPDESVRSATGGIRPTGELADTAASPEEKKGSWPFIALRRFRPPVGASIFSSKNRPASRPIDSRLKQPAGSPSSFYLNNYEQRMISFEGAACVTQVRRHLQSEKIYGKVVNQSGPYLLSGNWWDEKSWARAEWDLQLEDGELLRVHESEGSWKIDGIYD
jgi:protein ImuB